MNLKKANALIYYSDQLLLKSLENYALGTKYSRYIKFFYYVFFSSFYFT